MSRAQVAASTMPVTGRPRPVWKARTAATVGRVEDTGDVQVGRRLLPEEALDGSDVGPAVAGALVRIDRCTRARHPDARDRQDPDGEAR